MRAQQPEAPHPIPGLPKQPEQPDRSARRSASQGHRSRAEHRSAANRTPGAGAVGKTRHHRTTAPARLRGNMMTRTFPAAALLAAACIAAACDRTETSTAQGHDLVAGRHVDRAVVRRPPGNETTRSCASCMRCRPASTFDLFAGDLLLFDGLAFKTVTPYRAVDGKRYAFALRPAGMTQAKPLSSNTEDLKDGDFYTAIAMPGDGYGPQLRVVSDHLDSPAQRQGPAARRACRRRCRHDRRSRRQRAPAAFFDRPRVPDGQRLS